MVQAGYNTGPRHAFVFQKAKSYVKRLTDEEKKVHDTDVTGLAGIMWSIICALMPKELIDDIEGILAEEGLPSFATRFISEGKFAHS